MESLDWFSTQTKGTALLAQFWQQVSIFVLIYAAIFNACVHLFFFLLLSPILTRPVTKQWHSCTACRADELLNR